MKRKIVPRKLTERQIKIILDLYANEALSYSEIAARFGVTTNTIGSYVTNMFGPQIRRRGQKEENRRPLNKGDFKWKNNT